MPFRTVSALNEVARTCFPGLTPGALRLRGRLILAGLRNPDRTAPFLNPAPGSALERVLQGRPELPGILVWPYQSAHWEAAARLDRMAAHYAETDRIGAPLIFEADEKLVVTDLGAYHPGLRLVVDQPRWFMREGGLVLNMFVDDFRAFSLAFSLGRSADGRLQAVIGGLQGRNAEDALALYRDLTKALAGLRPRDFLIEAFRMLCRSWEVQEILAVTQAARHHQHPYFGEKDLTPDYDAIWEDRGGTPLDASFYSLPVDPGTRDLATVKPKKRSLYRRRFAFLDMLEDRLAGDLAAATPTRFTDT